MADKEAVREMFVDEFSGSIYPVQSATGLLPALSNGPTTQFEVGDNSLSAMELASEISDYKDFPYTNAEDLADDVMTALEEEGWF